MSASKLPAPDGITVSLAPLLGVEPLLLLTTQRYSVPWAPTVTPVTVSEEVATPVYDPVFARFVHDAPALVEICH